MINMARLVERPQQENPMNISVAEFMDDLKVAFVKDVSRSPKCRMITMALSLSFPISSEAALIEGLSVIVRDVQGRQFIPLTFKVFITDKITINVDASFDPTLVASSFQVFLTCASKSKLLYSSS